MNLHHLEGPGSVTFPTEARQGVLPCLQARMETVTMENLRAASDERRGALWDVKKHITRFKGAIAKYKAFKPPVEESELLPSLLLCPRPTSCKPELDQERDLLLLVSTAIFAKAGSLLSMEMRVSISRRGRGNLCVSMVVSYWK